MNKFLLVLNAVLCVAVIVLFILFFNLKSNKEERKIITTTETIHTNQLPIAYVNIDSLLLHYQFAKDANETLLKKQEDSRLTINMKARELQNEMNEFQKKLENNAFLSRERAEQEHTRLLKKQQDLQELDAQLSQKLLAEQQKMSEQLRDSLNAFLKEFNKNKKYHIILSNTLNDNILYALDGYDITSEVIKQLNQRCNQQKK